MTQVQEQAQEQDCRFEGQVKLIYHNAGRVNEADDPAYPYRLECNFGPPDMMQVTFIMLYGGSELIAIKGKTVEVLKELAAKEGFALHRRLRRMKIGDADGKVLWSLQGHLTSGDCQWYEGDVDQNPPVADSLKPAREKSERAKSGRVKSGR